MSVFDDFADQFTGVAHSWEEHRADLKLPEEHRRQEIRRYEQTGNHVLKLVRATRNWPQRLLESKGVDHGVRVLTRYIYYGAAAGRVGDFEYDDIAAGLDDSRSFEPIDDITRNPPDAAQDIESPLGLLNKNNGWGCIDMYRWETSPTGIHLTIPQLEEITEQVRLEHGVDDFDDRMCAAHQQNALLPIYRAFVRIATTDQRLLASTLQL